MPTRRAAVDLIHCLRHGMLGGGEQLQLFISRWDKAIDTHGKIANGPFVVEHVKKSHLFLVDFPVV